MEVFVLSISRFNTLDLLEVFDSYDAAHKFAVRFCDIADVDQQYRIKRRSDQMRGWVIADSPKYFIAILERKISLLSPAISQDMSYLVSYNDLNDIVSGKTPAGLSDLVNDPVVLATALPPPSPLPATLIAKPLDNAYEDNLPAGFHYVGGRPLVMDDIKNDPDGALYTDSLSENQKWALVIARINKRPHFEIDIDNHFPYTFTQSEALKALKARNGAGLLIRNKELALLQAFYDKCAEDKSSSSDESSSEDSEYC